MNTLNRTLLGLMLTLYDLDSPLSEAEKAALKQAAYELHLKPTIWESQTQPKLLKVLQQNPDLFKQFLAIKSRIDEVGEIPPDFLPTSEELRKLRDATENVQPIAKGGIPESHKPQKTNEIENTAIDIFVSSDPKDTAKKISKFKALKDFLLKPIV